MKYRRVSSALKIIHAQEKTDTTESEEALIKHAKRLDEKVRSYEQKPESVPEELFTVPFKPNEKQGATKRKPKKTEKIVESAAQDAHFSPKKKKKTISKKDNEDTTNRNTNQERKKLQEVSMLKSSIVLTSMIKQFQGEPAKSLDEPLMPGNQLEFTKATEVPSGVQKTTEVPSGVQKTTEVPSGVQKTTQVPSGVQKTTQVPSGVQKTTEASATISVDSDDEASTSLLTTWSLCQKSNADHNKVLDTHIENRIPVPPPEVLTFFTVVGRPDVQDFMKKCAEHFQRSSCSHQGFSCFEDVQANQGWDYGSGSQESWRPNVYGDQGYHYEEYGEVSIPDQGNMDNYRYTSTPKRSDSEPHTSFILGDLNYTDISTSCPLRRSPRRSPRKQISTVLSDGDADKSNITFDSEQNSSPKKEPKKERNTDVQQNLEKKEPLLKTYDNVLISPDRIRASITAAKKASKPGYTLCYNLLLGVFTVEEMAFSRGQGLVKTKATDTRPVLSAEKISAVKEYTLRWCKKNEKVLPTEAEVNHAITEQVSHCRKKMKKQGKMIHTSKDL